jgi:tetratricopeptide (TPR) repeat protein
MNASLFRALLLWIILSNWLAPDGARAATAGTNDYSLTIILLEGSATIAPGGTDNWAPAKLQQKLLPRDKIHTEALSRVVLRSTSGVDQEMRERTDLVVKDPHAGSERPVLELVRGYLRSFIRGRSTDLEFNNLTAAAARGTEFVSAVDADGRVTITVFDGIVDLTNPQGAITITNGWQGASVAGAPPVLSPALNALNVIQWVLHYPGVLDVEELPWDGAAKNELSASLGAYRSGDLVAALNAYPANRTPATDAEKVYRAALILVVGEVEQAEAVLNSVAQPSDFSAALRQLIAAVRNEPFANATPPRTASGLVAESYHRQSQFDLEGARASARAATEVAPQFGFAWARLAELEFSFGRVDAARTALEKALALSPRHGNALALKGFLLSAQNKIRAAIRQFDEAILVDGALPEAWLGRGLCRLRIGDAGGREDVRTATALAPNRSVLRSYLGKVFSDAGDPRRVTHELELARQYDANDPTSWLYSALHLQQQNRINEGVRDLERSQELNDHRALYRSRLLLDQDSAVRAANLAGLYQDAGMTDVSVREAGRAVSDDYANYSAHLFLANSYEQLRDPRRINLRYETPTFAEYLVANLLAPVGAGPLSPAVSAQEYSRLLERDGLGVSSRTEYRSGGDWFEEGAQYGTFGNSSYSIEGLYRSQNGDRPNNDLEVRQFSAQFKQQLTAHDTVFLSASDFRGKSGDTAQYYDQRSARRGLRTIETQEPVVLAGYHREWAPGSHTLLLGARLDDELSFHTPAQSVLALVGPENSQQISDVISSATPETYRSKLTIYSAELQQILQLPRHLTVVGGRFQAGMFDTEYTQNQLFIGGPFPENYRARGDIAPEFERLSLYAYHTWKIADTLRLIGGVAYDRVRFPANFRFAPVLDSEETVERISPKAGLVWTPLTNTAVRFAYAQAVGGASIDQSFQIEPSQVAGFNQAFRSLIPESVAGANAGARFETFNLSLEHQFPTRTYAGVAGEWLNSEVRRTLGAVRFDGLGTGNFLPDALRERLDFEEQALTFTLNQLVGKSWAFGARHRVSRAELRSALPELSAVVPSFDPSFRARRTTESVLNQTTLYAIYNHPSGFFLQGQALWTMQDNDGFGGSEPGDDFWQANVFAGWRFWRRRAEISGGVLNLGDRDYKLEPLTLYNELPRARTFVARLKFKF